MSGTNRRSASRAAPLPPAPLTPPIAPCNEATKPLRAAVVVESVLEAQTLCLGAHLVERGAALGMTALGTGATSRKLGRAVISFGLTHGLSCHPSSLAEGEIGRPSNFRVTGPSLGAIALRPVEPEQYL